MMKSIAISLLLITENTFAFQNGRFALSCPTKNIKFESNDVYRRRSCLLAYANDPNEGYRKFGETEVPDGQRPANEYADLVEQPLFGWASEQNGQRGLSIRLAVVYVAVFGLVGYPIAGATWVDDGYLLQKVLAANVGSLGVVLAILVRLSVGWGYIASRLTNRVVEYEETGWYDGAFEEKGEAEKARDLLLYRSDVKPVEERIKSTAIVLGGLWLVSCLGLNMASGMKPLFNEYDPSLLESLPINDKLANVASEQSNGRPTYCNSRYYRAVANGGQGCD